MQRREFLQGGLACLLLTTPTAVVAAPIGRDPQWSQYARIARALQRRMTQVLTRCQRRLPGGHIGQNVAVLEGVSAMAGIAEFRRLPLEQQVHPLVQDVIVQACAQLGHAVLVLRDVLSELGTSTISPSTMHTALPVMHEIVVWMDSSSANRASRRLRKALQRRELAVDVQQTIAEIDGLLHMARQHNGRVVGLYVQRIPVDLQQDISQAQQRWSGGVSVDGLSILAVLGLLAAGMLVYVGAVTTVVGLVGLQFALSMIVVLLVGVLLLASGILLWRRSRRLLRSRRQKPQGRASTAALPTSDSAPQPTPAIPAPPTVQQIDVDATRWHRMAPLCVQGSRCGLSVSGETIDDAGASVSAQGDAQRLGGADHHLPGAPEGALIGRVNGFSFVIGDVDALVVPVTGQLELVVNANRNTPRVGHLTVTLQVPSAHSP